MASTSAAFPLSCPSTTFVRNKSPHCTSLPNLCKKSSFDGRLKNGFKGTKNWVVMATGQSSAEETTELPEILKSAQETWDKLEDKYAVASLGLAGIIAIWGSSGLISAIDRLPLIPGVFELIGIGYSGWFVYQNLVFKPDREALFDKIKNTFEDIIGSS